MDLEAQKLYLRTTGAAMQQQSKKECNIFGGEASCMQLSKDSDFGHLCPNHDMKVDCAYYTDDEIEINEDPIAAVQRTMDAKGLGSLKNACPTCFNNQRALWCAQTVPKCGSYSTIIENTILPMITRVTQARQQGASAVAALAPVVPELLQATSLSMPCREMCEAVVSSCSCDREQHFGPLLEDFINNQLQSGMKVPQALTMQLFGSVYNLPICSLYGNASNPNFGGTCTHPASTTCEDRSRWCGTSPSGNNSAALEVQELMAGQVANALFGWIDAPGNDLFSDARGLIDDADDKDQTELENKYLKRPGQNNNGRHTSKAGAIAHWVAFGAVVALAAGGGVAFWQWNRRQNASKEGYLAMTGTEEDAGAQGRSLFVPFRRQRDSEMTGL
ncbi:hypothetical protein WJX73_007727 [Symbiochloris irregularis]|uniref:Uncharacterized protein n=1 Tax=Symbiochloris irregularis TaxID=706552 RepID=A0AAW1PY78_9CHLO